MALPNIINRTSGALKSVGSVAVDGFQMTMNAGSSATSAVAGIGSAAVGLGVFAKDAVIDTADAVAGYTGAAFKVGVATVSHLSSLGIAIAMIVAPVPTFIGLALIEVLTSVGATEFAKAGDELDRRRAARKKGGIVDRLTSYGEIPATALVETPMASLRLNTIAGTIEGTVKAGRFTGRAIEEMSVEELRDLAAAADDVTGGLVRAYLRFRNTVDAAV